MDSLVRNYYTICYTRGHWICLILTSHEHNNDFIGYIFSFGGPIQTNIPNTTTDLELCNCMCKLRRQFTVCQLVFNAIYWFTFAKNAHQVDRIRARLLAQSRLLSPDFHLFYDV